MGPGNGHRVGARIGNVRIQVGRRRFEVVRRRRRKRPTFRLPPPATWMPLGFLAIIAAGTLLLTLPIASEERAWTSPVTALFTATSAVSTTGLVVVDTHDYWSGFGEAVVLALIQAGGIGFMLTATLLLLVLRRRISFRYRLTAAETVGRLAPEAHSDLPSLARRVVGITLAIEAIGFALMVPVVFMSAGSGDPLRDLWRALFTTISAFNTAGFDVEGGFVSLAEQRSNVSLLVVTMGLAMLGAMGFAVWSDIWSRRHGRRLAVDTKLFLATIAILWGTAFIAIFALETRLGAEVRFDDWPQRMLDTAYTVLSAGTTVGFATESMDDLTDSSKGLLLGLMFIGGASGSTAGGIKVTTWAILLFAILASLRGDEHVNAFEREIAWPLVHRALSVALLSVAVVFGLTILVSATTHADFVRVVFEGVSAFGTVGLSTGITPDLSISSQLAVVVVMFIGRVGPLSLALALAARSHPIPYRYAQETVSIG
jgi:trk system potassium uptake protein TrkH